MRKYILICIALFVVTQGYSQSVSRQDINLNNNWYTIANDSNQHAYDGFEKTTFRAQQWQNVQVPHNWDAYEGYRRLLHGNRHGYAWYRKTFSIPLKEKGKRYFLWFEGVGSYATVWLNGKKAGEHAGGRTTFTIDITDIIQSNNLLAVRADHPAGIANLPWVCGGCSEERGFSEGSQPMGIFRPVHLIVTNDVRIEPFGVHIWNDTTVSEQSATLQMSTTIKNYSNAFRKLTITQTLLDKQRKAVVKITAEKNIQPGTTSDIQQQLPVITKPHLWSLQDPYCYTLVTTVTENGKTVDAISTPYGIRWISWPVGKTRSSNQFFLNGKPVFLNGIGEYEHIIGASHAFSDAAVKARVQQIKAAGFNAFRDAHQPHNLRYQYLLDSVGILWWTQLSAHVWYDTKEFRSNFKMLLKEWVIERRNSPSLVLWGLQNESKLPEDFARECTELVRQLDPTTSSQRLVTTCNGGGGTDWDVPQNWTGTYGGNPATYAQDVKRQVLIGEYGAWRTIDLHTEGPFVQNGPLSEDRMTQLMEMKVRLAESVKDSSCGQFFWIYNSHDNPGRVQGGEGYRELDRIGPVNYKGLLTPWEEPLDVFYMYRANYAPKETSPMVYIVSHTWPNRWTYPARTQDKKDGIVIYSNCDEVELFDENVSLGKRTRNGIGTHFQWDGVDLSYNLLSAVGYVNGKKVATDCIVLNGLPWAPRVYELSKDKHPVAAATGYNYLYRVNCGGPDYRDMDGNYWMADREKRTAQTWGSVSWTKQFDGMPPYFASQRQTHDSIAGTMDWKLFQTFRYGREQLKYEFPVPDGDYLVELYFIEPWWGTGGGMDCTGWRLFDVAVNNKTVIKDLDIWKEAGHDKVLKKTVNAHVTGGKLTISFPRVAVGQALISAIAIATRNKLVKPANASPLMITQLQAATHQLVESWLNTGDSPYSNSIIQFSALQPVLYGADWIRTNIKDSTIGSFVTSAAADVFIALDNRTTQKPAWMKDYDDTKTSLQNSNGNSFTIYRKRFPAQATVTLGSKGNDSLMMYTVMVQPATTLQPAFDLKPTTTYRMTQATMKGDGINKQTINNRESMVFTKASGSQLEWTIDIGVADMYSLTMRYYNPATKTGKAQWQLLAADGTLMKTEPIEFNNTRPGKWNYFATTTGSMINAGKYTVRIIAEDAEGVGVGGLDVQ
jgi:beta-galactosidase